jgi:uncharacterized membrane protein YbhN (UPF0104 family)
MSDAFCAIFFSAFKSGGGVALFWRPKMYISTQNAVNLWSSWFGGVVGVVVVVAGENCIGIRHTRQNWKNQHFLPAKEPNFLAFPQSTISSAILTFRNRNLRFALLSLRVPFSLSYAEFKIQRVDPVQSTPTLQ